MVKKGFFLIVIASVLPALSASLFADSAMWKSTPVNGDWNSANNWTPLTVPNGPADTAVFGSSNQTAISLSANTQVNGITFAGSSAFTITASSGITLTVSGTGIANNSGVTQNFVSAGDGVNGGVIQFTNNATAGSLITITNSGGAVNGASGGLTQFGNNATAGQGTFINNGAASSGAFGGETAFFGSSTAGSGIFISNGSSFQGVSLPVGGITLFSDNSTAGNATFVNNAGGVDQGITQFFGASTAGNGNFMNNGSALSSVGGGVVEFYDTATAGNGTFTNNAGLANGAENTLTVFFDSSTAGHGTFVANGAAIGGADGGRIQFTSSSSADHGTFTINGGTNANARGGELRFYDNSSAGNATLVANAGINGGAGGKIIFVQGNGTGGTARVEVFGNGNLDISLRNGPGVTIGSLEGDGNVFLGENNLTVGSNGLSTIFSGTIARGAFAPIAPNASLTKIGGGTLTLSGANGYRGPTVVDGGQLNINSSITSAVTVNSSGTLGGTGLVNGSVTVQSGGSLSPGNSPGILNVVGNLTLTLGATYLVDLNGVAVGTQYDQTNVTGAVSLGSATLAITLSFTPAPGDEFTIVNNDGIDAVTGLFNGLPEGSQFLVNGQAFAISYQAGDGNDVGLTARAIPEPAATALLFAGALILFGNCIRPRNRYSQR